MEEADSNQTARAARRTQMKMQTIPTYVTKDLDEIAAFEMIGIMPQDYHHEGNLMFVEFAVTAELQQARKDFDLHRLKVSPRAYALVWRSWKRKAANGA